MFDDVAGFLNLIQKPPVLVAVAYPRALREFFHRISNGDLSPKRYELVQLGVANQPKVIEKAQHLSGQNEMPVACFVSEYGDASGQSLDVLKLQGDFKMLRTPTLMVVFTTRAEGVPVVLSHSTDKNRVMCVPSMLALRRADRRGENYALSTVNMLDNLFAGFDPRAV